MFCKFCGSKIALNENKCLICGAAINRQDGGQTFYEESELDAWKTEIIADGAPKTEMREPLPVSQRPISKPKKKSAPVIPPLSAPTTEPFSASSYKTTAPQAARSHPKTNTSAKKRKKKKDNGANKLIIFCISVVIAIVLLVVALIAAFSGGKPKSEPVVCPTCGSEDHVTHPVDKSCEICDSPFHVTAEHETAKPTCPQCGSTYHTVHPKAEQPKKEQPKQQQPKQEQPKQEQPKQDEPKQEQPKQEQPKQEQPKQDPTPASCPVCGSIHHTVHPTEEKPADAPTI